MRALAMTVISSLAALVAVPTPVLAQDAPAPGVRAAGMGGAFTAVADDATAVYWNPAGLASGTLFSLVLDRNADAGRSATLMAVGTPPLGLSYYRTATGDVPNGRNSLVAHHAGVTVLQSLADRIAVGATLKLVRGVVGGQAGGSVSSTRFDADLGVLARGSLGNLGLSVRNLTAPSFKGLLGAVSLERRVRAGISLNTGKITIVSADADLSGTHREAAFGTEIHPLRAGWVRGGLHWNTRDGDTGMGNAGTGSAPVGSVGASYAVYGSTVADAQVSFGSKSGNRGWGIGLRMVF